MIDVRGLATQAITTVNPDEIVTVKRSTGFTIGAGQRQIPSYALPIKGPANIQALDYSDLKQVDNLNIQGTIRAIYLKGALAGVVQPTGKGGDLILRGFPQQTWLVVKVLESWPTWTKACIVLQNENLS